MTESKLKLVGRYAKPSAKRAPRITDKQRLDWLSVRRRNTPGRDLYFPHLVERQSDQTWAAWDGENWHWRHKNPRAAIDAAISQERKCQRPKR